VETGGRLPAHSPKPVPQVLVHFGSGANEANAVAGEIRKAGNRADTVAAERLAPAGPHK